MQASGLTSSQGAATVELVKALQASGQTTSDGILALRLSLGCLRPDGVKRHLQPGPVPGPDCFGAGTASGGIASQDGTAGFQPIGTTTSSGTLVLRISLTISGLTSSVGTVQVGIQIPITATGQTASVGVDLLKLGWAPTGQTVSGGIDQLGIRIPVTAGSNLLSDGNVAFRLTWNILGETIAYGTATLALKQALTTTGQTASVAPSPCLGPPSCPPAANSSGGTVTVKLAKALEQPGRRSASAPRSWPCAEPSPPVASTVSSGDAFVRLAVPLSATGQSSSLGSGQLELRKALGAAGLTVSGGATVFRLRVGATGLTRSGGAASAVYYIYLVPSPRPIATAPSSPRARSRWWPPVRPSRAASSRRSPVARTSSSIWGQLQGDSVDLHDGGQLRRWPPSQRTSS